MFTSMNNVLPAEKWLQYLKSSGKHVYIFGAGSVAAVMKTDIDDYGIEFLETKRATAL
jgi:hypothetical protein